MENLRLAYCNECEDLVEYDICDELIEEEFKGETISYKFRVGKCKCCNSEVATDIDYNSRKSKAKIEAYKKQTGIISENEISEILRKYNIGKENLAIVAGFGKVTIKRYFEGFIPSREYSDVLLRILREEKYFMELVEENKKKLKDVAYKKIISRYERLAEISSSKIDQIANYIITHIGEVTPLALEKLLAFSNGVNYALNGKQLIFEESQAWAHGPVYPRMYNKYKKYGYKPIDDGIYSTHGCMLSKLSADEIIYICHESRVLKCLPISRYSRKVSSSVISLSPYGGLHTTVPLLPPVTMERASLWNAFIYLPIPALAILSLVILTQSSEMSDAYASKQQSVFILSCASSNASLHQSASICGKLSAAK